MSPTMNEVKAGHTTMSADDQYSNLDCLQDAKTFGIQIAAENWPVKPGGPGVLVVVDGVYATVVHDLSKPILLADLEPYERDSFSETEALSTKYPMYNCGAHWVAAMPTAADGHMLRVAPVFTWWRNVSDDPAADANKPEPADMHRARLFTSLPIINWPLLGKPYIGRTWSPTETEHRSGRIVGDAKHLVLDYTVAHGTPAAGREQCSMGIAAQDPRSQELTGESDLPPTGTVELPALYVNHALSLDARTCGSLSPYAAMLWAKKPSELKAYTWPTPGAGPAGDFWNSGAGKKKFKEHVKAEQKRCDDGEGDCKYGHSK